MTDKANKPNNPPAPWWKVLLVIVMLLGVVLLVPKGIRVAYDNIGLVSREEIHATVTVVDFERTYSHGRRSGSDTDANYLTKIDYEGHRIIITGKLIYEDLQPHLGQEVPAILEVRIYTDGSIRFRVLEIAGIPGSEFNAGILSAWYS